MDYLSVLDIGQIVAVRETGIGEREDDIILSCYLVCRGHILGADNVMM